jgi:hypothetical protein
MIPPSAIIHRIGRERPARAWFRISMVVEKRFLIVAPAGMSAALSLYGHAAFADDDGSSTQAALIQAEA